LGDRQAEENGMREQLSLKIFTYTTTTTTM
jgi:hypothetical protein